MDRLTIRNSDGSVSQPTDLNWADALERLAAYEDTGYTVEDLQKRKQDELWAHMFAPKITREQYEELCDAMNTGRMVILPAVSESSRANILDFYRECRQEWIHDPSVGLFGPNEDEEALMLAIEAALEQKGGNNG